MFLDRTLKTLMVELSGQELDIPNLFPSKKMANYSWWFLEFSSFHLPSWPYKFSHCEMANWDFLNILNMCQIREWDKLKIESTRTGHFKFELPTCFATGKFSSPRFRRQWKMKHLKEKDKSKPSIHRKVLLQLD